MPVYRGTYTLTDGKACSRKLALRPHWKAVSFPQPLFDHKQSHPEHFAVEAFNLGW